MRCVGYIRVSTKEQDEEVQLKALQEFIRARGIELAKTYVDKGESGGKPFNSRPAAQQLLNEVDQVKPDCVLAWSLDRLGRTMLDTLSVVTWLEDKGVRVITVKEEFLQVLDPSIRKLVLSILSWVAEFEKRRIRERQEEAWRQGKTKGRPPSISDDELIEYYNRFKKYGNKKYVWMRVCEELEKQGRPRISYTRFLLRLKGASGEKQRTIS